MDTETEQNDVSSAGKPSAYDSNPFTATWSGIQKLVKSNSQTVVGVALFNILLTAVLIVTAAVMFLGLITFIIKHNDTLSAMYTFPSNTAFGFLTNMSDGSIYLTWVIGLAVCVFIVSLLQSLQLNLSIAAARSVTLKFGALLKQSVRSVLPILGYVCLVVLAIVVAAIVIALLSLVLGYITVIVALVAIIAAIYAGLRLSFAVFAIVDQKLGPVHAMKASWKMTNGHLIETVGSGSIGMLVITVPDIILTALSRITEGAPMLSGLFGILSAVITPVLVIAATMAMAERYTQIRALNNNEVTPVPLSSFNYLAIVTAIFLSFILNALSPKMDSTQTPASPFDTLNTQTQDTNFPYSTNLN